MPAVGARGRSVTDAVLAHVSDAVLAHVSDAVLAHVSDAVLAHVSDAVLAHVSDAVLAHVSDAVLAHVSDAVAVIDGKGRITAWNPAAADLLRHSEAVAVGSDAGQLLGGDEGIFPPQVARQGLAAGGTWRGELSLPNAQGTAVRVHARFVALAETDGLLVLFRDAAETGAADRRRRETEERLRAVADHAQAIIVVRDPEGCYLMTNRRFDDLHRLPPGAAIGRTPRDLVAADRAEELLSTDREVLRSGQVVEVEQELSYADGSTRTLLSLKFPVPGPDGRPAAVGVVATDITGRKKAETDLLTLNDELTQFAHVVSHDLRAPLRAILSYADFLVEDLGDRLGESDRETLDGLVTATRQLHRLVDDLLAFVRVGRDDRAAESVPLGNFLRDLIEGLALESDQVVVVEGPWPTIETSASLVGQVFRNLILNGLKFNRSQPRRVAVTCREVDDGRIAVSVTDNGIGIPARYHRHIFSVFNRLHDAESFPGTGIGLAIVDKAVTRLGGSIEVDSQDGRGSVFTVILPRSVPVAR